MTFASYQHFRPSRGHYAKLYQTCLLLSHIRTNDIEAVHHPLTAEVEKIQFQQLLSIFPHPLLHKKLLSISLTISKHALAYEHYAHCGVPENRVLAQPILRKPRKVRSPRKTTDTNE